MILKYRIEQFLKNTKVVQLVKKDKSKPTTCAIGDGANDVSMIQEAHVGFGIFGKEGRNAARCSDFAIAKFKFIRRALLVHGFLYYTRLTILVHYFFYKASHFLNSGTPVLGYRTTIDFSVVKIDDYSEYLILGTKLHNWY